MIFFRSSKDGRDIPVYFRKQYKKARYKKASERMSPGYWEQFVKVAFWSHNMVRFTNN